MNCDTNIFYLLVFTFITSHHIQQVGIPPCIRCFANLNLAYFSCTCWCVKIRSHETCSAVPLRVSPSCLHIQEKLVRTPNSSRYAWRFRQIRFPSKSACLRGCPPRTRKSWHVIISNHFYPHKNETTTTTTTTTTTKTEYLPKAEFVYSRIKHFQNNTYITRIVHDLNI